MRSAWVMEIDRPFSPEIRDIINRAYKACDCKCICRMDNKCFHCKTPLVAEYVK